MQPIYIKCSSLDLDSNHDGEEDGDHHMHDDGTGARKIDRYPIVPSDEGTYEWLEGQMALLVSTTMVSCGKGWQRRGKSGAILPLI